MCKFQSLIIGVLLLATLPVEAVNYCTSKYTLSQPMTDVEVSYTADILWDNNSEDYLIEYSSTANSQPLFVARINGDLYRYDGHRLSIYNSTTDSLQFINAQKACMLYPFIPSIVASDIAQMKSDTACHVSQINDHALQIVQYINGYKAKRIKILEENGLPISLDIINNPDQLSEQNIMVSYNYNVASRIHTLSVETLAELYPDIVSANSHTHYSVETLRGKKLPRINAIDDKGESHEVSGGKSKNTIIVFMESGDTSNSDVVSNIRSRNNDIHIVWIYTGMNFDYINEEIGNRGSNELVLGGGKRAAKKLGITKFPTILQLNDTGVVSKIITK